MAALTISVLGLTTVPAAAATNEDLGDAPANYDVTEAGPARATLAGPRLGVTATADQIDPETQVSTNASESGTKDTGDDAVPGFDPMRVGRLGTFTYDVVVSQVAAAARVCGWVDFNQSGTFSDAERSCADAPVAATRVKLTWTGLPAGVGTSYVRLRIGLDPTQVQRSTGLSDTGEVEDYPVSFAAQPSEPTAQLSLAKTAEPTTMSRVGQEVTYTYRARNTGDLPLTQLRFSDELLGLSELSCEGGTTLAVGASKTCTATRKVTQDDLDFGSIFNFAAVSAERPDGDSDDASDDVTALDDATVSADVNATLKLASKASANDVSEGTLITFTFTATNAGNVDLDGVRITTGLKGMSDLACTPQPGDSLAPGADLTCTGEYTVTRADAKRRKVTATATVRAEAPYGDTTATADDVVARVSRTVSVVKPVDTAGGSGGSNSSNGSSSSSNSGSDDDGDGLADTGGPDLAVLAGFAALSLTGAALNGVGRRRSRNPR